jgi:ComF family protein
MLKPYIKTLQRHVEHWLFPAACVLCGKPGANGRELCADCLGDLPYNNVACAQCASPLSVQAVAGSLCGRCQQTPPSYDRAFSAFHYTHPVAQLIHRLKFNAKLNMARLLGELMADHLHSKIQTRPELIIPVPLHRSRLRGRGFNQALEIARPVAGKLGIPIDYQSCVRARATVDQLGLTAKQRRANVKDAFSVVRPVQARHVAVMDDVMTTGHTLEEVAKVLRTAGVEQIDVWVVARA